MGGNSTKEKGQPAPVKSINKEVINREFNEEHSMYGYDKNKKKWTEAILNSEEVPPIIDELRVVTYNIWFGKRYESVEQYKVRMIPLLEIIKREEPHIICLQECTQNIVKIIMEDELIREKFWISDNLELPNTLYLYPDEYNNLILTRLPCLPLQSRKFPSMLGRILLFITIPFNYISSNDNIQNTQYFRIGTVHLESYQRDVDKRKAQLEVACSEMPGKDVHCFLMGDFNIHSEEEEKDILQFANQSSCGFVDTWSSLRPNEDGFTFDSKNNIMTDELTDGSKPRRIDFILHPTSPLIVPKSISLIGTERILDNSSREHSFLPNTVFPSDHFGLSAAFTITNSNEI